MSPSTTIKKKISLVRKQLNKIKNLIIVCMFPPIQHSIFTLRIRIMILFISLSLVLATILATCQILKGYLLNEYILLCKGSQCFYISDKLNGTMITQIVLYAFSFSRVFSKSLLFKV
jgi:hypothetical protein